MLASPDQSLFLQNCILTQQYCDLQLLNSGKTFTEILRSIIPLYEGVPVFSFKQQEYIWYGKCKEYSAVDWNTEPLDKFEQLFDKQLELKRQAFSADASMQTNGKILVCDYYTTVLDGASEAVSDGFIDVYDLPPIDTWFHLENDIVNPRLYAWIPDQFIALVDAAIAVNCLDLLNWAEIQ